MYKSNLKYKSNLYVLNEDFRHNDKEFFSKIDDPDLLYFYKYRKHLSDHCFSEMQKKIIAERSICSNLKYPDPCWGKCKDNYICRCVNKDCKELENCRKGILLTDEEYNNFAPEKYKPIDYEYTGIAKDTYYYPIKTFFADEYDSYKSFEIRDEEYGQVINTNKDSVIWEDSPELVNIQEEFDKEIEEFNYANDNEFEDEEIPDTIYEQQSGEFRIVEQEEIINASINESFLVNAGPGTGKTYTLIHKINHIIKMGEDEDSDEDIDSSNIYVLSFTNAAVKEIYDRLVKAKEIYGIKDSIRFVNLRTFDSFIYYIINRAQEEYTDINIDNQFDSYAKSRETAIKILQKHPDILRIFEMKYFIVDEIQDLTNSLAQFVLAILNACKEQNIPFTLFGDTCQAIYDYSQELDEYKYLEMSSPKFYTEIKELFDNKSNLVELIGNKRQTKNLSELSLNYRDVIINERKEDLKEALRDIDIDTKNLAEIYPIVKDSKQKFAILSRNNGQVLDYASKLRTRKINFVINPSGKNIKNKFMYAPWIAQVFSGYKQDRMFFDDFENIIQVKNIKLPEINYKEDGKTSIKIFWEFLTKSSNELLINDFMNRLYTDKSHNPIFKYMQKSAPLEVSTIHKAKGREYDQVYIDRSFYKDVAGLSRNKNRPEEKIDEHRIMYVALTRPKKSLSLIVSQTFENIGKIKGKNIWYKGPKTKPDSIGILENFINYDEFTDDAENIRQNIKYNTEIRLTRSPRDNFYHIETKYNKTWVSIGKMELDLTDEIRKILKYKGDNKNLPSINKLYVDKIFTYLRKNNDETYTPVTGISFTGFGKLEY